MRQLKKGIEFNAHRIFDPNELIEEFEIYNFKLQEFHLINDEGSLTLNAKLKDAKELNFGGGYFVYQRINIKFYLFYCLYLFHFSSFFILGSFLMNREYFISF